MPRSKPSDLWMILSVAAATILAVLGITLYRRRRTSQPPLLKPIKQPLISSPSSPTYSTPAHPPPRPGVSAQTLLKAHRVTVVSTVEECERTLQSVIPDPIRVVGLDCEWRGISFNSTQRLLSHAEGKGNGKRECGLASDCPVALLQLAFTNGEVVLVRLCEMAGVGERMREILTNKSVLKFGVGIGNDTQRLSAGIGVHTVGCVDLQNLAVRCGIRKGTSLEGLARQLLGVVLDKSFHLRCGDWEAVELSYEQIKYAALDAVVALHILQALILLKMSRLSHRLSSANLSVEEPPTQSLPNRPGQSLEAWLSEGDHLSTLLSLCQGVIDVGFKQTRSSSRASLTTDGTVVPKKTGAYSVRRSRLYHNCRLLAPDGQLLSTLHQKKLEWYLERGLGSLVNESPMTVQLHFEPAGRPGEDRKYYLREKENICAVCGTDQNCVRKNIVPHEYRRHFPPALKEHLSHDVLLLCTSCHQLASHHSGLLKMQIAAENGFYDTINSQKYNDDPKLRQVKNYARVLLKDVTNIPDERVKELRATVSGFYGVDSSELTLEMIQDAAEIDPRSLNTTYTSHSEKVVKTLLAEGGDDKLFEFMKRWRQYFLDTMEPKFLPQFWSVDHNPK